MRRPRPETPLEAALVVDELARAAETLFSELRPQIERVAPGQKRRRMPAAGYRLFDTLWRLRLYTRELAVDLAAPNAAPEQPAQSVAASGGAKIIPLFNRPERGPFAGGES
jgi:hypothetical protein